MHSHQVYESADDAKEAVNHLNGFHLMERYIIGKCAATIVISFPLHWLTR